MVEGDTPQFAAATGSRMAEQIQAFDWSKSVGQIDGWSQSLQAIVRVMLSNGIPMCLLWGPDLLQIYNDAYVPLVGQKHPTLLGQRFQTTCPELWESVGPIIAQIRETAQATTLENQLFPVNRFGYLEELYCTIAYAPVHSEAGDLAGVLMTLNDTTRHVLSERRWQTLYHLSTRMADAHRAEQVCQLAVDVLSNNPADLPFALLYLVEAADCAQLAAAVGLEPGTAACPRELAIASPQASAWPLSQVDSAGLRIDHLPSQFGALPGGQWTESPESAFILPLTGAEPSPVGFFIAGLSPRLGCDQSYQEFLALVARQISTAIAAVRAEAAHLAQFTSELTQLNEERYRILTNAIPQLVWINQPDGRISYFNQRWQTYTGVALELNVGLWPEIIHPDDFQGASAIRSQAIQAGEAYEVECRLKRCDGVYRWHLARIVPLKTEQGEILCWFGTATDIDEIKQVAAGQQFLAEASSVLAKSLDEQDISSSIVRLSVPFLADFCCFDLLNDGALQRVAWQHVNPNQQLWFNRIQRYVPTQDFYQHPIIDVLQSGDAKLVTHVEDDWVQAIATSEEHLQFIRDCHIQSIMTVPLIAHDRKLGVLTFCFTADSARRYNSTHLALAKELAHRAAFAVDNAQLYHHAQEANRVKDEFLAILSHELRSPLNPILGWSKLLQVRKFNETSLMQGLQTIERNAKLQTQLIDDLLDVARILRGKLSLEVEPVDLELAIDAALETVHLAAVAKSIQIQTYIDPQVGAVAGDAGRLQQVIWNLLSNAVKFTPEGGRVEVRLERKAEGRRQTAELDTQPSALCPLPSAFAEITVSDTGKGISAEFLPHVFDYFRQADSKTTRKFGGLGLGLAIVRHIVELHGGTVWADSPGEDQGATFTVSLPLLKSVRPQVESNEPAHSPSLSQHPLQNLRVLVVDDEVDSREMVTVLLQQSGAIVTAVTSATAALQALAEGAIDIVISDIAMPDTDGYMLMQRLRTETKQAPPAIALTAYAGEANQQKALAAGFQAHLSKPIEPTTLVATILDLLH
jgi:PAS domain S-box-containing protein